MSRTLTPQCLSVEFVLIFLGLPLLLWWQNELMRRRIIPQILLLALLFLIVLWRDPSFDRRMLRTFPADWQPCLARIASLF
ncbi:MAG: hypothetical protein WBX11_17775, partial [Thiobacillaceae bacterium]